LRTLFALFTAIAHNGKQAYSRVYRFVLKNVFVMILLIVMMQGGLHGGKKVLF